MSALVQLFLDIMLMRPGPQDVPASTVLCAVCTAAYALLGFLSVLLNSPPALALAQTVLDLVLLTGFTQVLLERGAALDRDAAVELALTALR